MSLFLLTECDRFIINNLDLIFAYIAVNLK